MHVYLVFIYIYAYGKLNFGFKFAHLFYLLFKLPILIFNVIKITSIYF